MSNLTSKAIRLAKWRALKERLEVLWMCVWIFPLLLVLFIGFTLWELFDKKGSQRFWDEVYSDPYA